MSKFNNNKEKLHDLYIQGILTTSEYNRAMGKIKAKSEGRKYDKKKDYFW